MPLLVRLDVVLLDVGLDLVFALFRHWTLLLRRLPARRGMSTTRRRCARASSLLLPKNAKACDPRPRVAWLRQQMGESVGALRGVFVNPNLRRVQLAFA